MGNSNNNRKLKTSLPGDNQTAKVATISTEQDINSMSDTMPLILIVDDNADNLQFLGNLLAENNYEPAVTINGMQAIEFLENEKPVLILLDIMMPGIDGFEVCKRIKENPVTADIPIIFLTAKSETEDIIKGFETGAVDYLSKPFNPNELLVRLKTHIDLYNTKQALLESNTALKKKEEEVKRLNSILRQRIDEKTEKLELVEEEMIRNEYKTELADVTSETLHNVKNLLNSVKTSSELVAEAVLDSESTNSFRKANKLLKENIDNVEYFITQDPKGKKLLQYYLSIEMLMDDEIEIMEKELRMISQKVDAIAKLITTQQIYGKKTPGTEYLDPNLVIEDALAMQSDIINGNKINIDKALGKLPEVKIIKPKLIHVLINLIRNASDAMESIQEAKRTIKVASLHLDKHVEIRLTDSGCGILKENLPRLFEQGFTTKKEGHGYGLHSCLKYMEEMEGNITAISEGHGKGTTFVVRLPVYAKGYS